MPDPGGVLGAIVRRKRADVAARLAGINLAQLRGRAAPSRRSLAAALARPGARFVMEVKKAAPSGGPLRRDADVAAQAAAYAGAASAVSVLTDGPFFGGALEDLGRVRRVFDGPILAKDFIVDARQVPEARLHGADAVLVLLSVLDDEEARRVIEEARRLRMEALVEARDETEVRRAVALGAAIVGINNRDLRALEVDLASTERLAPLVPRDRLVVSESGIAGRDDVERLARYADAFLVGTSLMRAERPAQAARTLAFGRVKVCGVRHIEDVEAACRHGAAFVGMVMVPGTPRAVTAAQARPLVEAARRLGAGAVGIFRNENPRNVDAVARALGLDAVQLHGDEEVSELRSRLPGEIELWAAVQVGAGRLHPRTGADRLLFDSGLGGTGRTFDWSRVRGRRELGSALLAGGLRPDNARTASRTGAWALDVSSGVERAPGRKDGRKLRAFFEALRPAARGGAVPC